MKWRWLDEDGVFEDRLQGSKYSARSAGLAGA